MGGACVFVYFLSRQKDLVETIFSYYLEGFSSEIWFFLLIFVYKQPNSSILSLKYEPFILAVSSINLSKPLDPQSRDSTPSGTNTIHSYIHVS